MTAQDRFFFIRSSYLIRGPIPELLPCCKADLRIRSEGLKEGGFTLVELAIALMVIGLLIGGVLKGQELIENARMTSMVRQLNDYETAIMLFRNTYNAMPGDMKEPAKRLHGCNTDPCRLDGSNNNQVNDYEKERTNVWVHMQYAGLISGANEQAPTFDTASPLNPWDAHSDLRYRHNMSVAPEEWRHYYSIGDGGRNLNLGRTRALDQKIDDGKASSGRMGLFVEGANCFDADTLDYTTAPLSTRCFIGIASYSMD